MVTDVVGSIAALLSVISFAPQAWRIIRTREVKGLSIKTYAITSAAFALWVVYGVMQSDWPIIVPNILCLLFALFILMMLILPETKRDNVAKAIDPDAG